MKEKIDIGVLISGSGTNLQAILDACADGRISGTVRFIASDNPRATGLERGNRDRIPTVVVDYDRLIREFDSDPQASRLPTDFNYPEIRQKQALVDESGGRETMGRFFRSRAVAEAALLAQMQRYPYDLLVCAGFMRKLTPYFIDRVNLAPERPRIMNIHPALLPAFPGTDGYGDTFRFGCKIAGCTVHFIDYGEDTGPIIGQRCFAIEEDDTLETVKKKGLRLEWELYPHCIELFARGRLTIEKRRCPAKGGGFFERKVVRVLPD